MLPESPRPVVYVQINYRLGAFGFLAGPSFTLSPDTIPNAGLHDQLFALEWVQKNICLFGGNKDEVTAMGVSAGGGSIMHLMSAYGGHKDPLFKRAIPLSPGYFPMGGHGAPEAIYKDFESQVGCMFLLIATCFRRADGVTGSNISCLRAASSEILQKANLGLVTSIELPNVGPEPVIDGEFIQDSPAYLFLQGRFRKDIDILVSGDIDEVPPPSSLLSIHTNATN